MSVLMLSALVTSEVPACTCIHAKLVCPKRQRIQNLSLSQMFATRILFAVCKSSEVSSLCEHISLEHSYVLVTDNMKKVERLCGVKVVAKTSFPIRYHRNISYRDICKRLV
ncbi:hypothetical protein NC653_034310 [Populus alba x Populus x berolinensis]|uniref:Uncharacterized protein n=1 Tax=Populus alba x Populus x berolinensis TaxID=444605 RepID=A0AAD6LME6_9ROSI|nr:hypothetical protein NC653_034310 [Populus alba x Populus x berolinensis]